MFKVCGTKSERYCTDLDAYISKKKKVPANEKCYHKEICLLDVSYLFIEVYIPIIFLHSLVDLVTASHNLLYGKW